MEQLALFGRRVPALPEELRACRLCGLVPHCDCPSWHAARYRVLPAWQGEKTPAQAVAFLRGLFPRRDKEYHRALLAYCEGRGIEQANGVWFKP